MNAQCSNIYASVYGRSREEIAASLRAVGWTTRKAGREEIEARDSISELWIDAQDPVLVHGVSEEPVATVRRLVGVFRGEHLRFTVEIYDQSDQLVAEERGEPAGTSNAGSRPSPDDSAASETPSTPAPRG